jgi:hypothetical protein
MFFTLLVFGAALTLELFGSYISIMGLSKNASYILVGLAITLDFAKIIIATVLYKQWKNLHGFLKYTLIPPLIFLIIFTSSGAYAFLIQEFSKTTTGQEQAQTRIEALEQEKVKLEARKKEIDGQIAKLPPESVVQRRRLTELFAKEMEHINTRTIEMDKEIPELKIKNMADTTQGGTIGSIAKAYNVSAESITKVLVFPLVLVIDPLAIILLTVANFLVEQRKKEQKEALNRQLEIEALMAAEAKNRPPAPIPAPTVAPAVVAPPTVPDPPPIPPVPIELPVSPAVVVEPAQPAISSIAPPTPISPPVQAAFVEPIVEPIVAPVPATQPATKNNAWMMPFSNPISTWKNKAATNIAPVIPVAEPAIEDVMAELSNLETPLEHTSVEPVNAPIETVVELPLEEIVESIPETVNENIQTVEAPEVADEILDSIEDIYDEAPDYQIVTPAQENNDLASEEEVKMALAELEDHSFQESSDPSDLIEEIQEPEDIEVVSEELAQEPETIEEDMFAEVDEALEKAQDVPEVKEAPKRTFTFPPQASSDITEQINDDIFDNYEVSDSEIMQVMGVNEKDRGFDTAKVLEEDLF